MHVYVYIYIYICTHVCLFALNKHIVLLVPCRFVRLFLCHLSIHWFVSLLSALPESPHDFTAPFQKSLLLTASFRLSRRLPRERLFPNFLPIARLPSEIRLDCCSEESGYYYYYYYYHYHYYYYLHYYYY